MQVAVLSLKMLKNAIFLLIKLTLGVVHRTLKHQTGYSQKSPL